MHKSVLLILFLVAFSTVFGQKMVNWSYSYDKSSNVIEMHAEIAEGWHLYSQYIENEIGPIPTSFEFEANPQVKFLGKVNEPESIKEYDPNFEGDLNFFKESVVFTQKIKTDVSTDVEGTVTYMICNDVMCMPPTDEIFRITIE